MIAENGYHDTGVLSFTVSRANPVDANLFATAGLILGTTRGGVDATLEPEFSETEDEYTSTVPESASVYIRATGLPGQGDMEVMHNGTVVDALTRLSLSNQDAEAHDYEITVPSTGNLQGHRVTIAVESEDGVTFTIEVSLHR